jgi:predicted DNA-binding transcriptional regulator AlpA
MGPAGDRRVRVGDLLNAGDVAAELGISANSVYVYRHRYPDFPAPVLEHGRCYLWHRADIRKWARGRGKR